MTQLNPLNEVYLMSKFDVSRFSLTWEIDFQTGHFAVLEQFKVDSHATVGQVKTEPTRSFKWLCRSQLFYWCWARCCAAKNNPTLSARKKNSGTMHRVWHKSFSMIQSAGIKNWVLQLIGKLQRFSLSFLSVTRFSNLSDKIKYTW